MTLPTRQREAAIAIATAVSIGEVYQVTLENGTVLWIPANTENRDYVHVEAWADAEHIPL